MLTQFYLLVIFQGLLLGLLLFRIGAGVRPNTLLFAPICWFVLFYFLCFWVIQLLMPVFNFTLIGLHRTAYENQLPRILETQKVLNVFLTCFALTFVPFAVKAPKNFNYRPLTQRQFHITAFLGILGFVSVIIMIFSLNATGPWSMIVSSTTGKLLYAVSFWLTLGYFVSAAYFLKTKQHSFLILATLTFAGCLLLLGGRGRVLWPIVGLIVWAGMTGHLRIKIWKLLLTGTLFGVILQTLDPILLYFRGYDNSEQAVERFKEGLDLGLFFYAKNFAFFHNVAIIVGEDRVSPSWHYLFNGSQAAFMGTYFPSVARGGVGFPATLPGGLWLAGRWLSVALGGGLFGLFFAILSRIYRKLESEYAIITYCIAMPWLANIGTSYLDSYFKMAALILPGVCLAFWFKSKQKRRRVRRLIKTPVNPNVP